MIFEKCLYGCMCVCVCVCRQKERVLHVDHEEEACNTIDLIASKFLLAVDFG